MMRLIASPAVCASFFTSSLSAFWTISTIASLAALASVWRLWICSGDMFSAARTGMPTETETMERIAFVWREKRRMICMGLAVNGGILCWVPRCGIAEGN